jgi:hypothetical protein
MTVLYKHKKRYIKRIRDLYLRIDQNDSDSISLSEFFKLIDLMEENSQWQIPFMEDNKYWLRFRNFINKKFYLKKIVSSVQFEILMFVIVIVNSIILLLG